MQYVAEVFGLVWLEPTARQGAVVWTGREKSHSGCFCGSIFSSYIHIHRSRTMYSTLTTHVTVICFIHCMVFCCPDISDFRRSRRTGRRRGVPIHGPRSACRRVAARIRSISTLRIHIIHIITVPILLRIFNHESAAETAAPVEAQCDDCHGRGRFHQFRGGAHGGPRYYRRGLRVVGRSLLDGDYTRAVDGAAAQRWQRGRD